MTEPADVLSHLAEQERARILSLMPGPELNVEVGRVIFGIKRFYSYDGKPWEPGATDWPQFIPSGKPWRTHSIDAVALPRFSEEAGAAWSVVEALPGCCTKITRENVAGVRYDVTINLDESHTRTFHARAGTMPLAVARAALIATLEARPR
jgi:hypothetical protein